MQQEFINTWNCAKVICRNPETDSFLAIEENGGSGWTIPYASVQNGEKFQSTAISATKEQAGIDIQVKGFLRFEQNLRENNGEFEYNVILYCEPKDKTKTTPKSEEDEFSKQAKWFTLNEFNTYLNDVKPIINKTNIDFVFWWKYIQNNGNIYDLSTEHDQQQNNDTESHKV